MRILTSVSTLVSVAREAFEDGSNPAIVRSCCPDVDFWSVKVHEIVKLRPNPAIDLGQSIPSSSELIKWDNSYVGSPIYDTDRMGYSVLMRWTLYISDLLSFSNSKEQETKILLDLGLMTEVVNDRLKIANGDQLFKTVVSLGYDKEMISFAAANAHRLVEYAQRCKYLFATGTSHGISATTSDKSSILESLISSYINHIKDSAPESYYAARALCNLLAIIKSHTSISKSSLEYWLSSVNPLKAPMSNALVSAAILQGFSDILHDVPAVTRLCNEVVASIVNATPDSQEAFTLLTLLSTCLEVYHDARELPIAKSKGLRVITHILRWDLKSMGFEKLALSFRILKKMLTHLPAQSESVSALTLCLSYWATIETWLEEEQIPALGRSLELYSFLNTVARQKQNDEEETRSVLEDQFLQSQKDICTQIIKLLELSRRQSNGCTDDLDTLLLKVVATLNTDRVLDEQYEVGLYPLLASDSREIQSAAFDLIRRTLQSRQEDFSVKVALKDSVPEIQPELLSLIMTVPNSRMFDEFLFQKCPVVVRSYLLPWVLVLEAFPVSTFEVREGYIEHLKREKCIDGLLSFVVDILGHSIGDPTAFTADTSTIRVYNMWQATSLGNQGDELSWLLINLYFLALNYTPYLVKQWLDDQSKQTRIHLQDWTQKHLSSLLIEDALDSVGKWSKNQQLSGGEQELHVKVSKVACEVSASYPIDDTRVELVIQLPKSWPLGTVTVYGDRGAVDHKRWTNILMTTKAIMEISVGCSPCEVLSWQLTPLQNKSISYSLERFRKNVSAALKGHTECSICYSIISADKRMPDKRCATCKNLFHGKCLYKWFSSSSQNSCPLCRTEWGIAQ